MTITLAVLALAAGFVVLVLTGDFLVRGATALARGAGVSPLIVGLTVVAFGTSAPELLVGVQAVLGDAPRLALGNIVGSNIANVFLVLGLPALIAPIAAGPGGMRRNAVFGLIAAAALILFSTLLAAPVPPTAPPAMDGHADFGALDWRHGAALMTGLVFYLGYLGMRARRGLHDPELEELEDIDSMEGLPQGWARIWAFVLAGLVGLPIGSWLIVTGGVDLAEALEVPNEFVGLTMIAFGTSLPELAATFVAALRRHTELAIGNILGSNLFNILAVGGAASLTGAVPVPEQFVRFDFIAMAVAALVLLAFTMARRPIGKLTGAAFLLMYAGYVGGLAHLEGMI